jgi:hypothetical protein
VPCFLLQYYNASETLETNVMHATCGVCRRCHGDLYVMKNVGSVMICAGSGELPNTRVAKP